MRGCPFCDEDNAWLEQLNPITWVIKCHTCKAQGPPAKTTELAEKKWNGILKETTDQKKYEKLLKENNLIAWQQQSKKHKLSKNLSNLAEEMGGVGAPMATLSNTPGMGNAQPAQQAATTGSQFESPLSTGSGDKWGEDASISGLTKKNKVAKTNESFYPTIFNIK